MTVPISILPFKSYNGAGVPSYESPVALKCYVAGKNEIITSTAGKEEVSNIQFYLPGETVIKEEDALLLNGTQYHIKAIQPYYDGNTGQIDIKVVFV